MTEKDSEVSRSRVFVAEDSNESQKRMGAVLD